MKINYSGKTYNRLTLIEEVDDPRDGRYYLAQCSCGVELIAKLASVKSGHTRSCGCYMRERSSQVGRKHGKAVRGNAEYYIFELWMGIRKRCYNKNCKAYPNYGGRGITVYPDWRDDFTTFYAYIKENLGGRPTDKHSLNRIDNDGNYEPGNVEWSDDYVQARNKRNVRTIYQYTLEGELVRSFRSRGEIKSQLGFNTSNIASCLVGDRRQAQGFLWTYSTEPPLDSFVSVTSS